MNDIDEFPKKVARGRHGNAPTANGVEKRPA